MNIYHTTLTTGISRTKEFERKRLASFAVNIGTKCGHLCCYCSTGALLRMHHSFAEIGRGPFDDDYAIVDPHTPDRVAEDAHRKRQRGLVQLCTTVDAWSPEAQQFNIGRRCLEAILSQPGWTVRILTKNAALTGDFDIIARHEDRVLVGTSITATPEKSDMMSAIEPKASSNPQRMVVIQKAHARGFRTYAMFCPLLPGIADAPDQIDELVKFAVDCEIEEYFVEPVNSRGPGLRRCQEALELAGYDVEAKAIENIRKRQNWSCYVVQLLANVQRSIRTHADIPKLRFLLYPSRLLPRDLKAIRSNDAGVIWL